jgi:hypothetical protein
MHMQRQTSQYRASLILAAANAGTSLAPGEPNGRGRYQGYRDGYRDIEDFDDVEDFANDHRDFDYRDLSGAGADYDDQPTYWYWSYDQADGAI